MLCLFVCLSYLFCWLWCEFVVGFFGGLWFLFEWVFFFILVFLGCLLGFGWVVAYLVLCVNLILVFGLGVSGFWFSLMCGFGVLVV